VALQMRLSAVEGRAGLKTCLQSDLRERLPTRIEQGIYRIAQEAFNNILKHAHAHMIMVSLYRRDQAIVLEIADDGVGFEPQSIQVQGGLGLPAMQERAASMGGQLVVKSKPGAGTLVMVEVLA
jgi:two-component system NarL family sensor kinase